MKRDELVTYLDELLEVHAIADRSDNGLQVEGAEDVERVAFAVDASAAAFRAARDAEAQMLVVHHGLFWGEPVRVTGIHRRRLALLFEAGISLYAVHLPLDFHESLGNNATLARWLGLEGTGPFGDYKGQAAGVIGSLPRALPFDRFVARVEEVLGKPVTGSWPFGDQSVRRVAIVSGSAGSLVDQAAASGADVYLTGEVSHSAYHQALELKMNVVYGGHYATETAGLKALAGHLAGEFPLQTVFLDLPTGT